MAIPGKVQLWDVNNPTKPRTPHQHPERRIRQRRVQPKKPILAVTTTVATQLLDISDPANPRNLGNLPDLLVAFSPSGHILATTSFDDEYIRLWDISQPQHPAELATIPTGTGGISAFSPDGLRLVTNGADKTARVWDISNPRRPIEETTLRGHAAEVSAVAFSPDGTTIVTADEDHVIQLWDSDIERVAARVCAIAHPRITTTEWAQHFPGLDYQPPAHNHDHRVRPRPKRTLGRRNLRRRPGRVSSGHIRCPVLSITRRRHG
jgi:WD40 repeat protein